MGLYQTTYIGPYLEAPNPVKTGSVSRKCCTNADCNKFKIVTEDNFCAKCGTKIGYMNFVKMERLHFDCYSECNERLLMVHEENMPNNNINTAIFISNLNDYGRRIDDGCNAIVPISESIIKSEIEQFRLKFKNDIHKIYQFFSNVELRWGLITYLS